MGESQIIINSLNSGSIVVDFTVQDGQSAEVAINNFINLDINSISFTTLSSIVGQTVKPKSKGLIISIYDKVVLDTAQEKLDDINENLNDTFTTARILDVSSKLSDKKNMRITATLGDNTTISCILYYNVETDSFNLINNNKYNAYNDYNNYYNKSYYNNDHNDMTTLTADNGQEYFIEYSDVAKKITFEHIIILNEYDEKYSISSIEASVI